MATKTTVLTDNKTSNALALPAYMTNLAELPETPEAPTPSGSYVQSSSERSKNYAAQKSAGLTDGDFFLVTDGAMNKKMPLEHWLLQAKLYYTKMDSAGNVVAIGREESNDLKEHYVVLHLVAHNGTLVPCRSEFRTTKAPAVVKLIEAIREAATPEFAGKSDAHKIAAQFPQPWGRVMASVTSRQKTARASGDGYKLAVPVIKPTSISQFEVFQAAMKDPAYADAFETAKKSFDDRVAELEKKIK